MTALTARQLRAVTLRLHEVARQLCEAINQRPGMFSERSEEHLTDLIKGALLRQPLLRLGQARGLFTEAQVSSFVEVAQQVSRHPTLPSLSLLCAAEGLEELEEALDPSCYVRYQQALDELAREAQGWSALTESSLGALLEGLTGHSARRARELSCALRVDRAQVRWLTFSELKRLLGKRPTARRLQERLGLSAKSARKGLLPHSQPELLLSRIRRSLSARGVTLEARELLCELLTPVLSLVAQRDHLPLIASEGELIWEQSELRRQRGVHYTPYEVACDAVEELSETITGLSELSEAERFKRLCQARICDPAVGGGVFLVEHVRSLSRRHCNGEVSALTLRRALIRHAVYGVDVCPLAVEVTRASLWLLARPEEPLVALERHLRCADSLVSSLSAPPWVQLKGDGFELVICNPPYLNGIERTWRRSVALKRRLKELYPHSAVGVYDSAELFWERCCQLLSPGGRYGLLVPTVQLSNQGPFKSWLHARWRPHLIKLYSLKRFTEARVRTALIIGAQGAPERVEVMSEDPQHPVTGRLNLSWGDTDENWFARLSQASAPLGSLGLERQPARLAERFSVCSGCATGAAYELRAQLVDQRAQEGAGPMLITTGLIDRYQLRWGEKVARYLKGDYRHPRWPSRPSQRSLSSALSRQRAPKILVAGLSAVLEAFCDPIGSSGGVVQTWVIRPRAALSAEAQLAQCELLCAYLNSAALSYHFVERHGAAAMSGRQITVKKSALLALPLPQLSEPEALSSLLARDEEPLRALREQLTTGLRQGGASVERALVALTQLERDALTVLTYRALIQRAAQAERWARCDELAHMIVSVSYGCLSTPVLEWWRQRAKVSNP